MADNSDKIDQLEEIQDTGAASVTSDGTSVGFDAAAIARRKNELARSDDARKLRRPRISTIDLSKVF